MCGPGWEYVEKDASGGEISNRTAIGNPDVVGSWASLYEPDYNLESTTLKVNGYDRKVKILLPPDYSGTKPEGYPVIYYVGVNQRYQNAGADGYPGDDLFNASSWGLASKLESLAAVKECIIVSTYGFVAENVPYPNPEFIGTGQSDAFLDSFNAVVMKYINNNYNTSFKKSGNAADNVIMGADLGGVLATYAALTRPDKFGACIAVSPNYWIVGDKLNALSPAATSRFLLAYGSAEPSLIADGVTSMKSALGSNATLCLISGGVHNDASWGANFPQIYQSFWTNSGSSVVLQSPIAHSAPLKTADITANDYQLYSAIASSTPSSLSIDNEAPFNLVTNFRKGGLDKTAKVAVRDIDASVKTKYYWNVARLPENEYLLSSPKNVSFSSKKTNTSWLRIVILEDETVENVAASSAGFLVCADSGNTKMTVSGTHQVKATVSFPSTDKTFTIHYGSVNSESDMGAITETLSVSDECTGAVILYDFPSNQVTITETAWGEVVDERLVINEFSAVPSFVSPGKSSKITIELAGDKTYSASLTKALNYGTASAVSLTSAGTNKWTANLSNLSAGIYTLTLKVQEGGSVVGETQINIKVMQTDIANQQYLVVNAYKDIDWEHFGQYKGNFHTHTSQSFDTQFRTDQVVDRYKGAGYDILALTDHDANPYPWDYFDLYNPLASPRNAETLGMLAIPGVELSKDNRNNWSESTGGEFNHHNDFFTGRKGQEFASLRESYAYTNAIGGLQIINHPGQYWNLSSDYSSNGKNSPRWHADNFLTYPSLIGLEVYNQGNRRPNDRILWDQILDLTMPERPVWGYSCDDTHTAEQYFRNYDYMLMPELSVDALKEAMRKGNLYFCYEFTGSGKGLAPKINNISVDKNAHTITIESDATDIRWICSTDKNGDNSTRKSTVVALGKTFNYTGFEGKYVRALIVNDKGETCTQPFGFSTSTEVENVAGLSDKAISVTPNPADSIAKITSDGRTIERVSIWDLDGATVLNREVASNSVEIDVAGLASGLYIVAAYIDGHVYTAKLMVRAIK